MQPKIYLLLLAILLATVNIFAQTAPPGADEKPNTYPHGAQAIYVELGGNGLFLSANYDFRFTKSQKGFGMRLGVGFFGGTIIVPVGINHLAGKAPNYFESGIGITYLKYTGNDNLFFKSGSSGVALLPSIGYRYQPEHKGFFGRIAISPLIDLEKGGRWFPWAGIGLGYKF